MVILRDNDTRRCFETRLPNIVGNARTIAELLERMTANTKLRTVFIDVEPVPRSTTTNVRICYALDAVARFCVCIEFLGCHPIAEIARGQAASEEPNKWWANVAPLDGSNFSYFFYRCSCDAMGAYRCRDGSAAATSDFSDGVAAIAKVSTSISQAT